MITLWIIESFKWLGRLFIPPPQTMRRTIPMRGRCIVCGNEGEHLLKPHRTDDGVYVHVTCTVCYTAWLETPVSVPKLPMV